MTIAHSAATALESRHGARIGSIARWRGELAGESKPDPAQTRPAAAQRTPARCECNQKRSELFSVPLGGPPGRPRTRSDQPARYGSYDAATASRQTRDSAVPSGECSLSRKATLRRAMCGASLAGETGTAPTAPVGPL